MSEFGLKVDKNNGTLSFGQGLTFSLSKNECLILELLHSNQGSIICSEHISKTCWPGRVVSPVSVPVAIKHIRDVLKQCFKKQLITTHKGEGYSFTKANDIIISFGDNDVNSTSSHSGNKSKYSTEKKYARYYFRCDFTTMIGIMIMLSITLLFFLGEESSSITSFYEPTKNIHVIKNYPGENPLSIVNDDFKDATIFYDDIGNEISCLQFMCIEKK